MKKVAIYDDVGSILYSFLLTEEQERLLDWLVEHDMFLCNISIHKVEEIEI